MQEVTFLVGLTFSYPGLPSVGIRDIVDVIRKVAALLAGGC